jgi:hypothetical protein
MLLAPTSCSATLSQVDSFCAVYQKVIRAKGEGTINASLRVKQRIAANEVTYTCLCVNPQAAVCGKNDL